MTGSRLGRRSLLIRVVLAAFVCLSAGSILALGASDNSSNTDLADLARTVEHEYRMTELAMSLAANPIPVLLLGGGIGLGSGLVGGSVLAYRRRRYR